MMKAPRYRVGQNIRAYASALRLDTCKDSLVECRILYPMEEQGYFVSTPDGGFATIAADDVIANDEMPGIWNRSDIRVVFFGNGNFALPTLRMLLDKGYDVCAVVTMPDNRSGRGKKTQPSPVKAFAAEHGLRILQPTKIEGHSFEDKLSELHPTIGVVVEYKKLPKNIFSLPKLGTINLHSSLLPEYRGCSTISSAIKDGATITGVTTFVVAESIDTGDVINNYAVRIEQNDNASSVFAKLKDCGPVMVDDAIQRRMFGLPLVPQSSLCNEFAVPSYAAKTRRKDLRIPWHKDAQTVLNFIRAYSSVPGAWTDISRLDSDDIIRMKIFKASITNIPRGEMAPGEIAIKSRMLCIACYDKLLSVEYLQMPGRKSMTALEYINGYHGLKKGFCVYTF